MARRAEARASGRQAPSRPRSTGSVTVGSVSMGPAARGLAVTPGLQLLLLAGLASGCFPTKKGRAGVGDDLIPTPPGVPRTTGETKEPGPSGDTKPVPAKEPVVKATAAPTAQGPAVPTHPFKGLAYGAFPLESSEMIFQTGLKYKRSYWKVLKLKGEEKYFVFPSLRSDPTWLAVCDDEAQPKHELHKEFEQTLCKPGTSDAVTMGKDTALKVGRVMNDGLKYRNGPFYETALKKWRVFPSPHYAETLEVCGEQKSGPLGAWCAAFLKYPEEAEKRAYMLFETETEAKAMSASFNAVYGIPQ